MTSFNEEGLRKKLADLNMSQQSIQTMSLWLIHHKKHAHTIVSVWYKELIKASTTKKLPFMYLANDVIQNSKKKGPEYHKEYTHRLPKAFKHLASLNMDEKALRGISRMLQVWEERGIFNVEFIKDLRKRLSRKSSFVEESKKKSIADVSDIPSKKAKRGEISARALAAIEEEFPSALDSLSEDLPMVTNAAQQELPSSMSKVLPSPEALQETKSAIPPEPEEMIKSLQSLENAATADAEVRKKIADLPPSVSDFNGLSKLKVEGDRKALEEKVNEALEMLDVYNKRLADEMESRKGVARLLHDFILHQKESLAHSEEVLEKHKTKLSSVHKVRQELKAHLQNLPDISKLPNIDGTLKPLPSAGDLFT